MKKIYIINEAVKFDPLEQKLIPLDGVIPEVVLHTPVCHCLLLLLHHNGHPVSQKMLTEEVWEKNGSFATANTIYQNIAMVRKSLSSTGVGGGILKTLPKIGFQLTARIEEKEESLTAEVSQDELGTDDESASSPLSVDDTTAIMEHTTPLALPLLKINYYRLCMVLAVLLFILGGVMLYRQSEKLPLSGSYQYAGKVAGCELYSASVQKERGITIFTDYLKDNDLKCQPTNFAYLTTDRMYRVSSLLICDRKISANGALCQSYLHIRDEHDQ